MATSDDDLKSCQECGASIYPEHLQEHTADRLHGKLLCPHCLQAARRPESVHEAGAVAESFSVTHEPDNPSIALAADDKMSDNADGAARESKTIKTFGGGLSTIATASEISYRRPAQKNVPFATRCRTFHAKLNEASIMYLDRMINEWVDADDNIEIKFATSSIGTFEGKHADPNLIVTVFY